MLFRSQARVSARRRAAFDRMGYSREQRLQATRQERRARRPPGYENESEAQRAKWRAAARKQYAQKKAIRKLNPQERDKFRRQCREKAKKRSLRESAGRADDAPEPLRATLKRRRQARALRRKNRRLEDSHFRLKTVLRGRLANALRGRSKRGSAVRELGCTVGELETHLESLFLPGMSWNNFGRGPGKWNIDHIFPMTKADLDNRAHVLAVCNWRNLRPEWFCDNMRKSNRVTSEAQLLFDELVSRFQS